MFNNDVSREMLEEILNQDAIIACREGNVDSLSELLLKKNKVVCNFANYNDYFDTLCELGNLPLIKWFIENFSTELNFQSDSYNFLKSAAQYGHVHVVDYLITSEKEIGSLSDYYNIAFQSACMSNQLEIIDYFLHKAIKENKTNINDSKPVQQYLEEGLYYSSANNNRTVLEHFIITWDMKLKNGLEDFLKHYPGIPVEGVDSIDNLYAKHDLYKKLNTEINANNMNTEINNNSIVTKIVKKKI